MDEKRMQALQKELVNFLVDSFQIILESKGRSEKIYAFFTQHQQKLNEPLLQILPQVAEPFLTGTLEQQQTIALILVHFGILVNQFTLGQRPINLELSIAAFEIALRVYTLKAYPQQWATIQNNLGSAYLDRIEGEKAENIEKSIAAYNLALQVHTFEEYPLNWAMIQYNLAKSYFERIIGDKEDNLDKAIAASKYALKFYTYENYPLDWAKTQNNLGSAYLERIRDDRADNIEKAITAYQLALQVRTCKAFPVQWAMTQKNLADAFSKRIRGEKADNLEQAINTIKTVLQVYTRERFPLEWAATHNSLGSAYIERIQGDKADNIELAIAAFQCALQVRTQKAFPEKWAMTQNNLGNAYIQRIWGNKADNIEQAIAFYKSTLEVYTCEAFPLEWANTYNGLGGAYAQSIFGDRTESIEQSIAAYQCALKVYTWEVFPINWAMTQNNLGNAYTQRIRGQKVENQKEAITAFQCALQVRTRQAFPVEWATTQNNIGIAYFESVGGDKPDNLEQARSAFEKALEVYTFDAYPVDWAMAQHNLGNVYIERIRGQKEDNLEKAIASFKSALKVYNRDAFPIDWAKTQNDLAISYIKRIRGDRSDNIEKAIAAFEFSLKVFSIQDFPQQCRQTATNLGNLHFEQQAWAEAASAYTKALEAGEILYQSAILLDGKAAELAATKDLPQRAAYALTRSGDLQAAALTLEQGRARGLSETLDRDRADLAQLQQLAPSLYTQYADTTTQLRNLETQQRLRMTSGDRHSLTPEALRTQALQLRETLTKIIEQIRQVPSYEDFLAQPSFNDIRQALCPGIPLVYLVPTPAGSLALLVTQEGINDLWLDDLTENSLRELLKAWFNAYEESQTKHQAWLDAIDQGTRQLWQPLMSPLIDYLQQRHFQQATLIPTGFLSFLPLHAAWIEDSAASTGKYYALDAIHLTYAPNARSLSTAQEIAQRTVADSILAIDEPKHEGAKPLPNSKREVQAAVTTFQKRQVFPQEQATREAVLAALPHYKILHCSCHGNANLQEPLKSGLAMTGEGEKAILTLRDLLALKLVENNQGGIRVAILSACETGLPGIELADEAVSLPTGLLQAGVAGVVASLWSVSEISTMVLLTRFYTLWRDQHLEPSKALITAQKWLRDAEPRDVVAHCETFIPELASKKGDLYRSLRLDFSHPYYWAAFSYTGV
ncbi:MAG: CHAT domain-containing tetratricopeptide repeat protein [Nostoc sp. ChiQUE01a]|nr:CHAT domain-containing tetratricopeptide repeat protein [Nostoc sp. ChiQUE01a]